ncbi:hypothetical protein SH449x_003107 [Pirellulaceae bacterium SH449]
MRFVVLFVLIAVFIRNGVSNADELTPPIAVNICEGIVNTGAMDCVLGMEEERETCPNRPSSPCFVPGVTCEYNPLISGDRQCWFSQDYTWRSFGMKTVANNRQAFKYKPAGPGELGKTTKLSTAPGGWQKQVCEERFICYCKQEFLDQFFTCVEEKCGELVLLNVVKTGTNCFGQPGNGGPGAGGPGGGL